jgi:hypothetical protein
MKKLNCIFLLGSEETSNVKNSYGPVQFLNPNLYQWYHFVYAYSLSAEPKVQKQSYPEYLILKVMGGQLTIITLQQ